MCLGRYRGLRVLPILFAFCILSGTGQPANSQSADRANKTETTLISQKSSWKYLDNATPASNWTTAAFDDSGWENGTGILGFGDSWQDTPIDDTDRVTYYFRKIFDASGSASITHLVVDLLRDDGAVVHLNGVEILRDNMPPKPAAITSTTLASGSPSGPDEQKYFEHTVTGVSLNPTNNVIAVEVHQVTASSSDVSFDLALSGETGDPTTDANAEYLRLMLGTDPATSMMVGWTQPLGDSPRVCWGPTKPTAERECSAYAHQTTPQTSHLQYDMWHHFATLGGLSPYTKYYFIVKDNAGTTDVRWFRTLPSASSGPNGVSFILGGDSRGENPCVNANNSCVPSNPARAIANQVAGKLRPMFVIFSGDMAYLRNETPAIHRKALWKKWLADWELTVPTSGDNAGRMTPIVPAQGNHEWSREEVYKIFNLLKRNGSPAADTYYSRWFRGNLVRLFTLNTELAPGGIVSDSDRHIAQTSWLDTQLGQAESANVTWKVVQYHRPICPSALTKSPQPGLYNKWASKFSTYRVDLVVEADGHTAKITDRIRPTNSNLSNSSDCQASSAFEVAGASQHGTVYVGEGTWGAPTRGGRHYSWALDEAELSQFKWVFAYPDRMEIRTVKYLQSQSVSLPGSQWDQLPSSGLSLWHHDGAAGGVFTITKSTPGGSDPVVEHPIENRQTLEDGDDIVVDLNHVFEDVEDSDANLSFEITDSSPSLYSHTISAGQLTITPVVDAYGSLSVNVRCTDSDGGSVDDSFTLSIEPVNDPPFFTIGPDQVARSDGSQVLVVNWATDISAGPSESNQTLTFVATPDEPSFFDQQPVISTTGTLSYKLKSSSLGSTDITVVLRDNGGTDNGGVDESDASAFSVTVAQCEIAVGSIPKTSCWYYAGSVSPLSTWKQPGFDDSSWQVGVGILGFGDAQTTLLAPGRTTYYFRKTVQIVDASSFNGLSVELLRDDGAVVYLNGVEILRDNMPPGTVSDGTLASTTVSMPEETVYFPFSTPTDNLVEGENVVAVEVHQASASSSDVSFDLSLALTANSLPVSSTISDLDVFEDGDDPVVDLFAAFEDSEDEDLELEFQVTTNTNPELFHDVTIAAGQLSFVLADDENGSADITVRCSDSGGLHVDELFTLNVVPVNDPPSFTPGDDQLVESDVGLQAIPDWATDIARGPANEDGQSLVFHVTTVNPEKFDELPTLSESGTLRYNPNELGSGSVDISVTLVDDGGTANGGLDQSEEKSFVITINQKPVAAFSFETDGLKVDLDGSASSDSDGTIADYSWDFGDGATGNGPTTQHTFIAAGTYDVELTVSDDLESEASTTHEISVQIGNTSPATIGIANVEILEDASPHEIDLFAAFEDDEDSDEMLVYSVESNSAPGLFDSAAIDTVSGLLTLGIAPDSNGTASLEVRATDNGGLFTTAAFSVSVAPVNDAPTIVPGPNLLVVTDEGPYSAPAWVSSVSPGPQNESEQRLTFEMDYDGEHLFVDQPDIQPDGSITFTPVVDTSGIVTVTLRVTDDGGTEYGGVDTSPPRTFRITTNIRPVALWTLASADSLVYKIDATESYDPDGFLVAYNWIFGDGGTAFGPVVSHSFEATGLASIGLSVMDNLGAVGRSEQEVAVSSSSDGIPVPFGLTSSYPNPASHWTELRFSIGTAEPVRVDIYNILGETVRSMYDGSILQPGEYRRRISLNDLSSGTYFIRLSTKSYQATVPLVVAR